MDSSIADIVLLERLSDADRWHDGEVPAQLIVGLCQSQDEQRAIDAATALVDMTSDLGWLAVEVSQSELPVAVRRTVLEQAWISYHDGVECRFQSVGPDALVTALREAQFPMPEAMLDEFVVYRGTCGARRIRRLGVIPGRRTGTSRRGLQFALPEAARATAKTTV